MKRKTSKIFLISLLIGFLFETVMASVWQYDTLTYFLGVPVFIVFVWGFLLTFSYFNVKRFQKKQRLKLWEALLIVYIPATIVFETIGSQVLGVMINVDFPSLFPLTGCCKAPLIIYIIYYFVALFAFKKFDDLPNQK